MADSLIWLYANGATNATYATIHDRTGKAWNGSSMVTWTATRTTFAVALAQTGTTSQNTADMPGIPLGFIPIRYWKQVGGSASDPADVLVGVDGGWWDGTFLQP